MRISRVLAAVTALAVTPTIAVRAQVCTAPLSLTAAEVTALETVLADATPDTAFHELGLPGYAAPKKAASPVADGLIGSGEYPNVCNLSFYDGGDFTNPGKPYPPLNTIDPELGDDDLSAKIHLAHTDQHLFIAFEVTDEFLELQEGVNAFTNDSVELFINSDLKSNDFNPDVTEIGRLSTSEGFQIVADAYTSDGTDTSLNNRYTAGPTFIAIAGTPRAPAAGEFWSEGRPSATGWIVEYQIPLATLNRSDLEGTDATGSTADPASTGDIMLMNFAINDNDVEGGAGQDTHAMAWVVEEDPRSPFGGGENVWVVPLKLTAGLVCDLNGDGAADAADAAIMFGNWGRSGVGDCSGDGSIDAADAGMLFAEWTGDPVSSVPEPAGMILLGIGLFGLRTYRRRC